MAVKKYLNLVSGILTQLAAVVISAGSANDGDLVALNANGLLDYSVIPPAAAALNYTPAAAGTATLDLAGSREHSVQMPAGNITLALTNTTNARRFLVSITQDSVGSRTVAWFGTIRWAGGVVPTLTTTANKRDVFGFNMTSAGNYDGFVCGKNL